MNRLAIALDLGTSGFRAQALNLANGRVVATAITQHHPIPGNNVIDHLHFALESGVERTRDLMLQAINQVVEHLRIHLDSVMRLAVCGNPTQLSLFQGMEIRDLAFAGSRKLHTLGVKVPERTAAIRPAGEFSGLILPPDCDIVIAPAVHDEVGADALALILQSGILHSETTAIAIDYGTNAEMALYHEGRLFTGSVAAGPALEGQHITCGTVAIPGAISDIVAAGEHYQLFVLDNEMFPRAAAVVDPSSAMDALKATGPVAKAITGTGVIAVLDQALQAGTISLPHINTPDRQLHFGAEIFFTEADLSEAGKAIGAIRAGYITLADKAGTNPAEIQKAYLAGASGTYVDARKSIRLGLIPPCVNDVTQVGNTSLTMARELALTPSRLDTMSELAAQLRHTHTLFATSETFSKLFLLELSHWTEGMPMMTYRELAKRFHLPDLPMIDNKLKTVHTMQRDINDLGPIGLITLESVGCVVSLQLEGCLACHSCLEACPTDALSIDASTSPATLTLIHAFCNGVACRRCEPRCEPMVFHLSDFFAQKPSIGNKECW